MRVVAGITALVSLPSIAVLAMLVVSPSHPDLEWPGHGLTELEQTERQ